MFGVVIDHRNGQNSLSKHLLLLSFSICLMPIPSKYVKFYFTVPPAVSTLTEQTSTIAENLESTIDMSNLMLKYIPPETLFYRNMALMQKALFFASALNKGSYGYNGFGHNIVVDDFFEQEGTEPLRNETNSLQDVGTF